MTTAAIRQRLHSYLEVADDKKVKALYTMLEEVVEETAVSYNAAFKEELDRRQERYETGKTKPVSAEESKRRIQQLLKSGKKK